MAKLTWRGPDDYEAGETPPSSLTWAGITFPVGVAVDVDNAWMIGKARGNRMFKVEAGNGPIEPTGAKAAAPTQWREPATEADPADEPPGVSFFDDPPEPLDMPPDYPPEEDPKRKPGRPRKVKDNGL